MSNENNASTVDALDRAKVVGSALHDFMQATHHVFPFSARTYYSLALDILHGAGVFPSVSDNEFSAFKVDGTQRHAIVLYWDSETETEKNADWRTFAHETFEAFGFEVVWTGFDRCRLRSQHSA